MRRETVPVGQLRAWARAGFAVLSRAVASLEDDKLEAPTNLPSWTRCHLLAHLAGNANALGNLVQWAKTGEPTPMYASPERRADEIESGSQLPRHQLRSWLIESEATLDSAMDALTDDQWRAEVVTAQGRTVAASEIPWLRSREVWVHSVDLQAGVTYADLPDSFLVALCDDAVLKRSAGPEKVAMTLQAEGRRWTLPGPGEPAEVSGPLPEVAAYLTGRQSAVSARGGAAPPMLSPWL